jgi:hypothetical protein
MGHIVMQEVFVWVDLVDMIIDILKNCIIQIFPFHFENKIFFNLFFYFLVY